MRQTLSRIAWQVVILLMALSFADSTYQIGIGSFDNAGFPPEMLSMEWLGNALASAGWFTVLILSFRKAPLIAPELCWVLAGMFFFDVQTTWSLDMPLPPYFLVWGSLAVAVQIAVGYSLAKRRMKFSNNLGSNTPSRKKGLRFIEVVIFFIAVSFIASTIGLIKGDYNESGLPISVIPLHTWVNVFEAVSWLAILISIRTGYQQKIVHHLAAFLTGMWLWDMITTMHLVMPVPPFQIIWGPVSICVMLLITYQLSQHNQSTLE